MSMPQLERPTAINVVRMGNAARSSSGWDQGDVVAEGLEAGDEAFGEAFGVAALVVVAAEFAVGLAVGQHVPVGDEHRVLHGAERAAVPEAGLEALVFGLGDSCLWYGWRPARLLRGRSRGICCPCGVVRSGACRRTGRCPGSVPPRTRDARRRGRPPCRCRSQRSSPQRCGRRRR